MSKMWTGAVAAVAATVAIGVAGVAPSYGQAGLPTERAVLTDAPAVPPPVTRKTPARVLVDLEIIEVIDEIADGVKYTLWTYGGRVPGKMIRVREGDTVVFKLINKTSNMVPHNIDLHSVTGPGGGAKATLISPGEEASFEWKAIRSGVYVYHCATAPVPMHISNGMFGLCVVEPAKGLPKVDREFYVMQSEFYTQKPTNGGHSQASSYTGANRPDVPPADIHEFSFDKMLAENPDYVLWNGRVGSLTGANALKAKTGEKVRFFVGNGGLNLISSFHIIGDHLEEVYREGSLDSPPLLNVQNTLIPAGAAVMVDTNLEVPGELILVDHSLGRAFAKGGVGIVEVAGAPRPDIFKVIGKRPIGDKPADAPAGRLTQQQAQLLSGCKTCHDISPAKKTIVGPPLFGLYGNAPKMTGVPFTKWDRAALDEFLRDPSQVKPNTMMSYRVRENAKRTQIIDALEALR